MCVLVGAGISERERGREGERRGREEKRESEGEIREDKGRGREGVRGEGERGRRRKRKTVSTAAWTLALGCEVRMIKGLLKLICLCTCVCVCVWVRGWVCVRACVGW